MSVEQSMEAINKAVRRVLIDAGLAYNRTSATSATYERVGRITLANAIYPATVGAYHSPRVWLKNEPESPLDPNDKELLITLFGLEVVSTPATYGVFISSMDDLPRLKALLDYINNMAKEYHHGNV